MSDEKKIISELFNISETKFNNFSSYKNIMDDIEFYSISNFQNSIIYITNIIKSHIYKKINEKKLYKAKNLNTKDLNPKISIIIYCKEIKFLEESLISIIEQNDFFSFEIIIVYDNENKLVLNDNFNYSNIHILNNQNQRGIIYSFIAGALASKGEYILNFQSGYTFAKNNTLNTLYSFSKLNKIDVLEFDLLINKDDTINESSFKLFKCYHFDSDLNTSIIKYNKKYKEFDLEKELLINKLIRTEIYQDIIKKYKLINFKKIIYNHYDDILIYLLNQNKYTFTHINIFGVVNNIKHTSSLKLNKIANKNEQKINDSLFYINFLFTHSKNEYEDKKYVYDEYINLLSIIYNKFAPKSDISIKLFKKFIECKYIKEIDKLELSFFKNSLNN